MYTVLAVFGMNTILEGTLVVFIPPSKPRAKR